MIGKRLRLSAELLLLQQNGYFFPLILDHSLLLAIKPTCEHANQELNP
ncbi:hypothetical protein N8766_01805 [bacterium]|nr:hypothetical protein [bacterium]MDB4746016.1 hypothetical protein [Verrucomicrobiota bacterium]